MGVTRVAMAAIYETVGASPLTAFGRLSRVLAPISLGVAVVTVGTLSGSRASNVLDRLLRNPANVKVYSYVDIISYAVLSNLPTDVVRILPWAGVTIGPTGPMLADFWQKIGAVASFWTALAILGTELMTIEW